MKEINGQKYSQTSFDDYYWRVKIELRTDNNEEHNVDIYTTETSKVKIGEVLRDVIVSKLVTFEIVHWATKEQDDMASKFIDEAFKDWK